MKKLSYLLQQIEVGGRRNGMITVVIPRERKDKFKKKHL